jgi:DNA end-binding protein Ku
MARSSAWKGYLRVSLVSVPVKAYTALQSGGGRISFNQLHETCKSRISYKKVCPIHGEVPSDEIVSGYQFAKGQYVIVDTDEVAQLRPKSEDRSIGVDAFVPAGSIDDLYLSGKSYYLTPDGPVGQKPYQLLRDAMAGQGLHAVAKVILSNREQVVLVRPHEKLLVMSVLEYASQLKTPESFEDEITDGTVSKQELTLAKRLVSDMQRDDFDLAEYKDLYTERMAELVQAKVEGKEVVAPPDEEEPAVINLMDALKKSVAQVKKPKGKASRPAPKAAGSRAKRATKKSGRKKTG